MKTTPQLSCVAEDWMLLGGGVLYGFTRSEFRGTGKVFFVAKIEDQNTQKY